MPAILFALVPFFGWGIGDIFVTLSARRIGAYSNTFWILVMRGALYTVYVPFVFEALKFYTSAILLLNIIISTFLIIGITTYSEGLKIGNASLVGAISACFPAVSVILAILFLGERINNQQTVSIIIILLGIVLSSLDFRQIKGNLWLKDKAVILSLITMIAWGIYFAFIKIPVREVGWFWPGFITYLLFPFLLLYMKIKKIEFRWPTYKNALIFVILGALVTSAGDFAYNFAVGQSLAAVVAPIAGTSPVLFVTLAYIFFKDKITKQQILGIITTLIGIVLLSFFSV